MKQTCKSVLVVDDDRAILNTFSRILKKAGFSTEMAESGKEASEKIQTQTCDIALIDMILGNSNGLHLLSKNQRKLTENPEDYDNWCGFG